jgi:hypothetical protein
MNRLRRQKMRTLSSSADFLGSRSSYSMLGVDDRRLLTGRRADRRNFRPLPLGGDLRSDYTSVDGDVHSWRNSRLRVPSKPIAEPMADLADTSRRFRELVKEDRRSSHHPPDDPDEDRAYQSSCVRRSVLSDHKIV